MDVVKLPSADEGGYGKLWADLCLAAPTVTSARALSGDGSVISASWSQRDVISSKKRSYAMTYVRNGANYVPSVPVQSSRATEYFSPSGEKLVRFVEADGTNAGVDVEVWTVHPQDGDGVCLDCTWHVPSKVHRSVFSDEWFGGVAWSPDEKLFIYVADRPVKGSFGNMTAARIEEVDSVDAKSWMRKCRGKFDQSSRDLLGEAYINRRSPALFLADTGRRATRAMCVSAEDEEDADDESRHLYGDPQWSSNGKWIAVTRRPSALEEPSLEKDNISDKPYELGPRYCYNRYSSVELMQAPESLDDAETVFLSMTPATDHTDLQDYCCSSPRFAPDSTVLVYLSAPRVSDGRAESTVQPHNCTKVLRGVCLLDSKEPCAKAPITVVSAVKKATRDEFPGLYLHDLPVRPWLGTNSVGKGLSLLLTSVWGSELRVLSVKVETQGSGQSASLLAVESGDIRDVSAGIASRITSRSMCMSVSVFDVCEEGAVFCCSSPVHPPQLVFARNLEFDRALGSFALSERVSKPSRYSQALEAIAQPGFQSVDLILSGGNANDLHACECDATLAATPFRNEDHDAARRFQVTLLLPRAASSTNRVPLIVYPHGGPHSSSVNSFSLGVAAMLASNFAVMHVNFGGSLGLGQDSIEALPGKAGTADVSEVLQATRWAVLSTPCLDVNRVGYVGGSHGGFLGAHCSTVPGNLYKKVALRNPVVNIASMVNVTDIPEWAFCEAGVNPMSETTGLALCADPTALAMMWKASPVARVRTDGQKPGTTLLFVGGGDRRVPPEQSIEWHRLITEAHGAGVVTLRWYPESGHAIDEVPNGDDVWVHTLELFSEL